MRVGIQLDMRNPPPWHRPWHQHYGEWLDLLAQADQWGLGSVWMTEHHFFEDGYLPQLMTFGAAIAARTQRVRIGTGILIAPLHDPLHLAEQASLVDLISNGRVDLGLGVGYRSEEYVAFGQSIGHRYHRFEEWVTELVRYLNDPGVTPPAIQSPIPLWGGFHGPRGVRLAGAFGMGLIGGNAELVPTYLDALAAAGHPRTDARMVNSMSFILADDPERTWSAVAPHLAYMWGSYMHYASPSPTSQDKMLDHHGWTGVGRTGVDIHWQPQNGVAGGTRIRFDVLTPEQAETAVRKQRDDSPVTELMCPANIGGMPSDITARHIELLSTDLATRIAAL